MNTPVIDFGQNQQCPLCLQQVRQLGGILLITPGQLNGDSGRAPVTGAACVDCLGLVSMLLDGFVGGRINAIRDKLIQMGFVAVRR